ncbi:MAG: CBS domain-containing protein [Acidimicrobiia bacterium]|nr:CBS domain-containing protein [Acidimicrobiia bacterium]
MTVAETLAGMPVTDLDLSRYVAVPVTGTVEDTLVAMCDAGVACACVVDDEGSLVGVFTQRDVLHRVLGHASTRSHSIAEEMSKQVRTVRRDQTVAEAMAIMNEWWVRNVPVVGERGELVGNVSWYQIMETIADVLHVRIGEHVAGEVNVTHGLRYIDFTGLNTSVPVKVGPGDSAAVAAHHMRARGIGSVMVVDGRDHLVGVLTEFDLQMHVACGPSNPGDVRVGDIMTDDPVTVDSRAPIGDAVQRMADRGFSHVPLVAGSGRIVGVASFRDICAFFEMSLDTLV